ncbi:MAG: 3-hydroxyacyl-CoA dehydrogenase family protein [Planctomycetes bacterium]|nr:3-hydroxyacyl-CoA dehydrogenase family protein [Planctomycetota bacterium]
MIRPEELQTIAVVGLGKMGADWVTQLLEGGYRVIGFDAEPGARKSARDRIRSGLEWVEKKKKAGERGFAAGALERFQLADSEEAFVSAARDKAQVLLEVVFEDLALKCDLFARVVPKLPAETVVWTNTSSLSIEAMGLASGRLDRFCGTHGMNPVYQMPAVEVVTHRELEPAVLSFTLAVMEKMGKIPFVAADVPGFWVNKHLVPFMLEAMRALERGEITVEDGDKGLKNSLGHPQGVFKLADYIGADTMYRVAMAMYLATQDPRYYPPAILARMFQRKEFGVKTGTGFYSWEGGKPALARSFADFRIKDSGTLLYVSAP